MQARLRVSCCRHASGADSAWEPNLPRMAPAWQWMIEELADHGYKDKMLLLFSGSSFIGP